MSLLKMKRVNNLFDQIVEPENLRLAYWKASRRKLLKPDVEEFQQKLEENLFQIRSQLINNRFKFGVYNYFKVLIPKKEQYVLLLFQRE